MIKMIGLFGIIAHEAALEREKRQAAFAKMLAGVDGRDFHSEWLTGDHFSIGLTRRNCKGNKDLALKKIREGFVTAFSGYGKLKGQRRLCWAEEMADKVARIYEERGTDGLTKLEGSFACVIMKGRNLLILADRFSSKNLFYYQNEKAFLFAPDVGRLIRSDMIPKAKNLDAARLIVTSGFFPDDSTLAKGIERFPYSTLMEGVASFPLEIRKRRYWEVRKQEGIVDKITPDLIASFKETLERAVYELVSLEGNAIVPLSGGLDSRVIAYLVSKRQKLSTVTYDLGEEVNISKRVCKALSGSRTYFSNRMIHSDGFTRALREMSSSQNVHTVINQYFYTPLFKKYLVENQEVTALYDGIYLDGLFNVAYVFPSFEAEDFIRVYGKGANLPEFTSNMMTRRNLHSLLVKTYKQTQVGNHDADGVGKSQKAYLMGRLRRYVLETSASREAYAYVFKPGMDYDLVDFGYSLSLRLRKGVLYLALLDTFSEIREISYKDSYGIRPKTWAEKLKNAYSRFRFKVSYGTHGRLPYFPYQADWLFLSQGEIDSYRDFFQNANYIKELFDAIELQTLFEDTKKKHYLFNLFQRVLFLQQFYGLHGF